MTRLILIRHGQTDYNKEGRYCGFSNPPLNKEGVWQVKRLAIKLRNIRVHKIYSSDLKRAYQTAEIIFKGRVFERLEEFREINFGIFEGLDYKEIIKRYPALYKEWIDDALRVKIPKAERLKDLSKRVNRKLSYLLTYHKGKTIALVSHAGPIRIILSAALKSGLKNFWQINQCPAALNIIDYTFAAEKSAIYGADGFLAAKYSVHSPGAAGVLHSARRLSKVVKMNDISHLSA